MNCLLPLRDAGSGFFKSSSSSRSSVSMMSTSSSNMSEEERDHTAAAIALSAGAFSTEQIHYIINLF